MLNADRSDILQRAQTVCTDIRIISDERIVFTSDPALADIIITLKETTPNTSFYKAGDRDITVFNSRIDISARRVSGAEKADFYAVHDGGQVITGFVGDNNMLYLSTPEIINDKDFSDFVGKILSWYGETADNSEETPPEHIITAFSGGENMYESYLASDREKTFFEYACDYWGYSADEFRRQMEWSLQ